MDNAYDMIIKGRYNTKSAKPRVVPSFVLAIRDAYRDGQGGYGTIALKYGVSRGTVADIIKGRTWSPRECL